jgi:hypothetical protein
MKKFGDKSRLGLNTLRSSEYRFTRDNFNPVLFWLINRQKYSELSRIAAGLLVVPALILRQKSAVEGYLEGLNRAGNFVDFGSLDELKIQSTNAFNEKFWSDFQ